MPESLYFAAYGNVRQSEVTAVLKCRASISFLHREIAEYVIGQRFSFNEHGISK